MLGTRESIHALSKRILGLVVKDAGDCTQGILFLDGNPVKKIDFRGTSVVDSIDIDGYSYLLEIELEDIDVGIYTCFLYLIKEQKTDMGKKVQADVTWKIDYDHFLIIQDVSKTFDPDKVTQHWDVLVVVRANVKVHVCDLYKPMNKMQAEAQASRYRPNGSQQMLVEGIEKVSAIPINADGKEIEL